MRPAAKPITSIRASQLTARSAWSKASPPTGSKTTSAPEPAGQLAHPVADALAAVVDQFVGAVLARDRELFGAAGGGDDPGAHRLADLDRGQPDPAGGAEHQQRLARLQMAAMGQREMRGAVGHRKGGGGDEIHRIGDRHDRGGVDHDLLGIAAAKAQHRENPLPGPQVHRTAAPISTTSPAASSPGVNGNSGFTWYLPAIISVSAKLTPEARTRMRAWCGCKCRASTSSSRSTSGAPHSRQRIAFISCSSPSASP